MSNEKDKPSDDDLVLGKFSNAAGVPVGHIADIDSDDGAVDKRARTVPPYRKWVPSLMVTVAVITGIFIWIQYASGLVVGGQTVSVSTPISAAIYSDGVVEISLQSNPVKKCDSMLLCAPNQIYVEWRADGVLILSVKRESSSINTLADAPLCPSNQGTPNLGLIVLKSPTGAPPVAVIDGNTMKPIVTRVVDPEGKAVKNPGFVMLPTQGSCISPAR